MASFLNWLFRSEKPEYAAASPGVASRKPDPGVIVAARWRAGGHADRLFTVALLPDGTPQAFYQSSGRNSGMAGRWLPCTGVSLHPQNPLRSTWIEKSRFDGSLSRDRGDPAKPGGPLHRFGTPEAAATSERLAGLPIRVVATFSNGHSMNAWLAGQGYAKAAGHREHIENFRAAINQPMPQWDVPDPEPHAPEDLPAAGLHSIR